MSDAETDEKRLLANRANLVLLSVRTAAHELNNVFQMIGGAAELLLANPSLSPTLKPRIDSLLRQAARGEGIVRAVADLARAEGPGPVLTDIRALVTGALEMRRFEHRRSNIDIVVDRRGEEPMLVRADARDLVQIFLNLLIRAERGLTGRPDGVISVVLVPGPSVHEVTIASDGDAGDDGDGDGAAALLADRVGGSLQRTAKQSLLRLPAATRR